MIVLYLSLARRKFTEALCACVLALSMQNHSAFERCMHRSKETLDTFVMQTWKGPWPLLVGSGLK